MEETTDDDVIKLPLVLRALLYLLLKTDLEGDELAGTFLTLKEMCTWTEMESWITWLNKNNPTGEQVIKHLIKYINMKGGYDGRDKPPKTWEDYPINDKNLRQNENK